MAVKIRLKRIGKKKRPYYRVVVADSRSPRDGRFIEEIGVYDPLKNPAVFQVDREKVEKWLQNGAQPTDTVRALLKNYPQEAEVDSEKQHKDENSEDGKDADVEENPQEEPQVKPDEKEKEDDKTA